MLVGAVEFLAGIQHERALAGFAVLFRSGGYFEAGCVSVGVGKNAVLIAVTVMRARGDIGGDQIGLIGRNFILRGGAELRQRFGKLAKRIVIMIDGVGQIE